MAYIYQIINDINNKVYVGKTELDIEKRFKQHCSDSQKSCEEKRPLYAAMRKYGLSHFRVELIEETSNPSEREIYWIKEKNSYSNGYNATLGGDGIKLVDNKEVARLYQELGTQKAVAEALGICPDTVRVALHNEGVEINLHPRNGNEVHMYSPKGDFIKSFASYADAARWIMANNKTDSDSITKVAYGLGRAVDQRKRKTAFGYLWYSQKQ